MRRVEFDPEAQIELSNQLDYLIARNPRAARALDTRLKSFLENHLAHRLGTGTKLEHRNLWEYPVPRTRPQLVIWYTFTDDVVQIVHVWHASQNRDQV